MVETGYLYNLLVGKISGMIDGTFVTEPLNSQERSKAHEKWFRISHENNVYAEKGLGLLRNL